MRPLLALLLVIALAFSGCASKGGGGDGDEDSTGTPTSTSSGTGTKSGSSTATSSSSGTGTGAPAANRAPTAGLAASVSGGAAPLLVNFTLGGEDADGDALSWTLDLGNGTKANGTNLPALLNHTFTTPGTYQVNLTVSDGELTAAANVTVTVAAGSGMEPVTLTGSTTVASSPLTSDALGASGCIGFNAGESGHDCVIFELAAAYAGVPYTVTGTGTNPDIEFWESCDPTSDSKITGGTLNEADRASTVPAGAGCAILWFYSAGSTGTFTMVIG